MSEEINQGKVVNMLTAAFSTGEIDTLAFDLFPNLYGNFGSGVSKSDRVRQIVGHAVSHG